MSVPTSDSPVSVLTPQDLATIAVKIARRDLGLGALIDRDAEASFSGTGGAVVYRSVPGATRSHGRSVFSADVLTPGSITEQQIPIRLTEDRYSTIPLTLGDLSLNIGDYSRQVLAPQVSSLVQHAENTLAAAFAGTPVSEISYNAENPRRAVVSARAALRAKGVPADREIFAVAGAEVYGDFMGAEQLVYSGDDVLVKDSGIRIHENTRIDGSALYLLTREAFVLCVRAPQAPPGATSAASVSENGFALLALRAFSPETSTERSTLHAFMGASGVPLPVDDGDGTVTLLEHGSVVRVDGETATA